MYTFEWPVAQVARGTMRARQHCRGIDKAVEHNTAPLLCPPSSYHVTTITTACTRPCSGIARAVMSSLTTVEISTGLAVVDEACTNTHATVVTIAAVNVSGCDDTWAAIIKGTTAALPWDDQQAHTGLTTRLHRRFAHHSNRGCFRNRDTHMRRLSDNATSPLADDSPSRPVRSRPLSAQEKGHIAAEERRRLERLTPVRRAATHGRV